MKTAWGRVLPSQIFPAQKRWIYRPIVTAWFGVSIVVTGGSDADIPPNMVAYGLSWMVGAGDDAGSS